MRLKMDLHSQILRDAIAHFQQKWEQEVLQLVWHTREVLQKRFLVESAKIVPEYSKKK